jgi:hypothetical protein
MALRTGFPEFFFTQLRFISNRIWLLQLLIVLLTSLAVHQVLATAPSYSNKLSVMALAASAAPLIALVSIQLVIRTFSANMMEIELSTRYSLEKLMMVRLMLIGLVDTFCLVLLAVFFSVQFERELGIMLVYLFTPFLLTCVGFLFILTHSRAANGGMYCLTFGGFMLALQIYFSFDYNITLYQQGISTPFWLATLFIALLVGAGQVRAFLKTCRTLEAAAPPF